MPIVCDRKTGEIISKPEYTQEERNKLWELVVRKWIELHPDKFAELIENREKSEE